VREVLLKLLYQMWSLHYQGAILVPDKKLERLDHQLFFSSKTQNNLAFNPGLVAPPGADGSPLSNGALLVLQS